MSFSLLGTKVQKKEEKAKVFFLFLLAVTYFISIFASANVNLTSMKYISLPEEKESCRQLSFYLAMEEYVARHIDEPDSFFLWQVNPTVIFGRNQVMENEVDIAYCQEHGIEMYRRKSGGGCVYADRGNIMMSYITNEENVALAFSRFTGMLVLVLRRLGIEAVCTSHNDIMIGDRKVSGTAFYHLPGRSIVHSTMLYDTNMQHMTNAITPSHEKLEKKGIESVRQRITLLKDYINLTPDDFKLFVRQTLCSGEYRLSASDVKGIERIEQDYLRKEFIYRL